MFDVIIIGAGIIGCATAYELSQFDLNVLLLDKENDVSLGASRANTAIVHGGYDPDPATLMGKYNVKGAKRCIELVKTLDVEFRKTGSLIIALDENDLKTLDKYYDRGLLNGVEGMEMLDGEETHRREPNLSEEVIGALWIPESGVINPWEFTISMAEVAVREGVKLELNQKVVEIERKPEYYLVKTETDQFQSKYVVNAAGVHSDQIHNMVAEPAFKIKPTRGQYFLLDRSAGETVKSVIFPCPTELTKGILVSPTVHDNILVGPDAETISDPENTSTTREVLDLIAEQARRSVPSLNFRNNIRNYSGVRANSDYNDFFVKISAPNFLDLAAIKSPGLTCAPIIAEEGIKLLEEEGLELKKKDNWDGTRKIIRFKEIPETERADFIKDNPEYGRIICRCEHVTEGEIIAAIRRGLPIFSLDAIKRRAGSGLGRCQGGFCGPRVQEIIARETGISPLDILLNKTGSYILVDQTKNAETEA
ncbi:MAG: NAD(P)/FAD-dependent oxidoreductase [Saccharofermentanales bacterium]